MFRMAEVELSRGNRVGMEVGTLREKILVALLMYKFGADKVKEPPLNSPQADVIIEGHNAPISIKTKTGRGYSGVKLVWTVDWQKVEEFYQTYEPSTDLLIAVVDWSGTGFLAYVPQTIQRNTFEGLGRERYIHRPKRGTNPRGVEFSSEALRMNIEKAREEGLVIDIDWKIEGVDISYNPYARLIELWERD